MNSLSGPFFSIVVSVYNRPQEISVCLKSCFAQTFDDFEVIVVDDASTDDTVHAVETQFAGDRRLRLVRHTTNLGMGAARNTGIAHARGKWIVRIDSDHELLPNALAFFYEQAHSVTSQVGVLGAQYHWDYGLVSPTIIPFEPLNYIELLRWLEQEGGHDFVHCERKELHMTVSWPVKHSNSNSLFQLDWARNWALKMFPIVLGIQHTGAANSYLRANRSERLIGRTQEALDSAWIHSQILGKHGEALRRYTPSQYRRSLAQAAFFYFLAGKRKEGLRYAMKHLRVYPESLAGWIILGTGLLGPRLLGWVYLHATDNSYRLDG